MENSQNISNTTFIIVQICCIIVTEILRVPVTDVVGVGRSALLSWQGVAKKMHGKETGAIYVTIEDVGNAQTAQIYKEKEMTLDEVNALAQQLG